MSAPRCPRCDREGCRAMDVSVPLSVQARDASREHFDCIQHAVDWRARALSERAARESRATRAEQDADALAERLRRHVEEHKPLLSVVGGWFCCCCGVHSAATAATIPHADGCAYAADVEALSQHAQHVARRGTP